MLSAETLPGFAGYIPERFVSGGWHPKTPKLRRLCSTEGQMKVLKAVHKQSFKRSQELCQAYCDCVAVSGFKPSNYENDVRKLFLVSITSIDVGIELFKEFSKTIMSALQGFDNQISKYNPLKRTAFEIQGLIGSLGRREAIEKFLPFCQTRHLPICSSKMVEKKKQEWLDLITNPFTVDEGLVADFHFAAESLADESGPFQRSQHISLSGAGSLEEPASEGGRLKEMLDEIKPFFSSKPINTEYYQVGEFQFTCEPDRPRFQTFGLSGEERYQASELMKLAEPITEFMDELPGRNPMSKYGSIRDGFHSEGKPVPIRLGLWTWFGKQVYLYSRVFPGCSFVRASALREPGGKVRMITMMDWKSHCRQTVAADLFQESLSTIRRVEPIFTRANPIWIYLDILNRRNLQDQNQEWYVSDFSNATDSFSKEICKTVLLAYARKAGFLNDIVIEGVNNLALCKDVLLDDNAFETNRGVFMGEPLCKSALTIIMHCIDKISVQRMMNRGIRIPSWCFYAPGDDHIAYGPQEYIDELIRISTSMGAILNPEKIQRCRTGPVKICEQYIIVDNLFRKISLWDIAQNKESYEASAWIDTIKMKLFSPFKIGVQSSRDERLVVIGKARMLSDQLKWSMHLSEVDRTRIRNYFLRRFSRELPKSQSELLYLLLPRRFGGFGLVLSEDEALLIWAHMKPYMRHVVARIIKGDSDYKKMMDAFLRNNSFRGFQTTQFIERIVDETVETLSFLKRDFKESVRENGIDPSLPFAMKASSLRRFNLISREEFSQRIRKIFTFSEIIGGALEHCPFHSQPFKKRFLKVFHATKSYDQWEDVDFEELKKSIFEREEAETVYLVNPNLLKNIFIGSLDLSVNY
jgi:hypothetical protein